MATITLPSSGRAGRFRIRRSQGSLRTFAGVEQITQYPSRLWELSLEVPERRDADLVAWNLAMNRLSDMFNVFEMGPYWYTGPSTGYAGSGPLVFGGSQVGLNLVVDGLTPSVPILGAGDFISFPTVSPVDGLTNRQLSPVTAAVSSNGSGQATFNLLYPIRQSPADNAAVEIFSPKALFRFDEPVGGVDLIELLWAGFAIQATEKIFP